MIKGYSLRPVVALAGVVLLPVVSLFAAQPNAWQISDNSTASGSLINYTTNLTPSQRIAATNSGYRFSVTARFTRDFGSAGPAMSFIYGDGTRRFGMGFDLDPGGNLVATLFGSSNVVVTVNPVLATNYHTHRIDYDAFASTATYFCDDVMIATWPGEVTSAQTGTVQWGGSSSAESGEMNFHRVTFEIFGQGIVASYNAGVDGNPAVAPSPATQSWSRNAGATPIPEGPLSPDNAYLPPAVVSGTASSIRPGQATLNATVNPNGLPAAYWFEYGSSPAYDSYSDTNTVPGGSEPVSVNTLVTGLPRGGPRHFRVVATNAAGRSVGANIKFTVPQGQLVQSGAIGDSQAFDNRQPSIEVNYIICTNGFFPSPSGSTAPPFVGEIRLFAGNYAPSGWMLCHGQLLNIAANELLFFVIGTTYGGDGETTFALPDFRSRTVIGAGTGQGQTWTVGQVVGNNQTIWNLFQVPSHVHSLPPPDASSGVAGSTLMLDNHQASLVVSALIPMNGDFPLPGEETVEPVLSQLYLFAGGYSMNGIPFAAGQLLPINQNQAMFALLGTTYGGNGQTTFALPDLRGRTPMSIGSAGFNSWALGQSTGETFSPVTTNEMPTHQHPAPSLGILTGPTGGGQPRSIMQPSLAIRFLICTNGDFPHPNFQTFNQMLGQIQLSAGHSIGGGWAECNGQLLNIADHINLFAVIGTSYGGNGSSTFALPDFSGRVPVGAPDGQPGAKYGVPQTTLTISHMPSHTHSVPIMDYDRWITWSGLSNVVAGFEFDADGDGAKNGFEWATGSSPTNAASSNRLKIALASDSAMIEFPRNTNATDVVFALQRSVDLNNPAAWIGLATNISGLWTGVATETGPSNPVNVSISDPRTNRPSANYRLKLTLP